MTNRDKNLSDDLEDRIRARGVRVDQRLALLRAFAEPDGPEDLRRRIEDLKERMESAASRVREVLR